MFLVSTGAQGEKEDLGGDWDRLFSLCRLVPSEPEGEDWLIVYHGPNQRPDLPWKPEKRLWNYFLSSVQCYTRQGAGSEANFFFACDSYAFFKEMGLDFFFLGVPRQHPAKDWDRVDSVILSRVCYALSSLAWPKGFFWQLELVSAVGSTGQLLFPCSLLFLSVSWGCCCRVPPIWWLKTTEIYPLPILETRSLKSRCYQQGGFLLGGWEGKSGPCLSPSFWGWPASLDVTWLVTASFPSPPLSSHGLLSEVCLCPNFPLLIRTSVVELGPILVWYDLILTWFHLQTPYFQIRSRSRVEAKTSTCHFGGTWFNLQHSPFLVLFPATSTQPSAFSSASPNLIFTLLFSKYLLLILSSFWGPDLSPKMPSLTTRANLTLGTEDTGPWAHDASSKDFNFF